MGIVDQEFIETNDTENVMIMKYECDDTKIGYYLVDQNLNVLTPMVDKITCVDQEGLFEVEDRLIINENVSATLHYYITHKGVPVGFAFLNIFPNEYFSLGLDSSEEYRKWYKSRKNRLAQQFSEMITSRTKSNVAKTRSLALYKKSVIESEN